MNRYIRSRQINYWLRSIGSLGGVLLACYSLAHVFAQADTPQIVADTYVVSGKPDQSQPADLRVVWVGYNQTAGYGAERALFKFDLATLPVGSTVLSARLSLYLARAEPSTDSPMMIHLSRLQGEWTESITWQQQAELVHNAAHAAVTTVGTEPGWYDWNVAALVQSWADDPARGQTLSLLLTGNENSGERERAFWSKDCKPADCEPQPGNRPQLVIAWQPPTPTAQPTVTFTPTAIPTPTPTPTPTPGLAWVRLQNEPRTELAPGDVVTYTLTYQNGPYALSGMQIRGQIPAQTAWLSTLLPSASGALLSLTGTSAGSLMDWTFPQTILPHQSGQLVYRLRRLPAPTAAGLVLTKHGPPQAQSAQPIQYDLVVTNQTTTTVTNLVITDTIPLHAHYLTGGQRVGDQLQWAVATLAPGSTITKTFTVTATQSLINRDYGVQADGGLAAVGTVAVVTLIGDAQSPQPPQSGIIHAGGYVTWRDQDSDQAKRVGMPFNAVYNPSFDLHLPIIQAK